jgi:hypothetical protein
MDIGLKSRARSGEADRDALSAAELIKVEENLKAELETALASDEIDAGLIISIRERLAQLPLKISAARISELRTRLGQIEDELLTADENKNLIRQVQEQRKAELQEQLKNLEPYYERFNLCSVQTSFVNNDIEMLRIERKEKRSQLFSLSDEIRK